MLRSLVLRSQAATEAVASALRPAFPSQGKKKNLFMLCEGLPNYGVGSKVYRAEWDKYKNSYWTITRVKFNEENKHYGKAWGYLTWQGQTKEVEKRVTGPLKKPWRFVEEPHSLMAKITFAKNYRAQRDKTLKEQHQKKDKLGETEAATNS
eukprot:c38775_g1_i1.p1 GENE.c38775_g1_i1~~c38775_g1_i1.p1  ORF type:complete len:161 (-),score=31.46 c38775_g1_i1:108-560(-)